MGRIWTYTFFLWLGWQDLNLRMPESKSGALTTWRHPNVVWKLVGRAERIELTTSRATIWRSNQLSYARHILVRLKRFELLTHGLEGRCSIQLSYRRIRRHVHTFAPACFFWSGWWESDPRGQLGRLEFYHWTTPALVTLRRRIVNACI